MTPIPPASAMAIASLASVTVSIAAERIGRLRRIVRVSCVPILVALGMTALNPGRSRTSSNASPSGIKFEFDHRHRHASYVDQRADGARLTSAAWRGCLTWWAESS